MVARQYGGLIFRRRHQKITVFFQMADGVHTILETLSLSFKKRFIWPRILFSGFCLFAFLYVIILSYPCVARGAIAPDRNISVVRMDPDMPHWKTLWDRARSFARQGRFVDASLVYKRLFKLKPDIEEASWEYCKVLIKNTDYNKGSKVVANLLEKSPNRIDYLLAGGDIAYRSKDFSSAVKFYGKAFEGSVFGKDADLALLGLINSLRKDGKKEFAFPLLEQLRLRDPENGGLLRTAAGDAAFLGKNDKAAKLYRRLMDKFPLDDGIILKAAKVYESAGLLTESVSLQERYLQRNPNYVQFRKKLIGYYTGKKDFAAAIVHLSYLALNSLADEDYLVAAGDMYLHKLGRPDKSLLFYEKFLEKFPEDKKVSQSVADIQSVLANDFLSIVENDGAWLLWRDLAKVTPNRVAIYLKMASLLKKKGMTKELLDILKIIYHHSSGDEAIAFRIAKNCFFIKNYRQSLDYLLKIKKIRSREFFLLKGDTELNLGLEERALNSYRSALSLAVDDTGLRLKCLKIAGSLGLRKDIESLFSDGSTRGRYPPAKVILAYLDQLQNNYLFDYLRERGREFLEKIKDPALLIDVKLRLALSMQKEGRIRGARQALRELLGDGSAGKKILMSLTANALENKNLAVARAWYLALEEITGKDGATGSDIALDTNMLLLRARLLKMEGEYEKGITIVRRFLENPVVKKSAENGGNINELENELCWLEFYAGNYQNVDQLIKKILTTRAFDSDLYVLQKFVRRKIGKEHDNPHPLQQFTVGKQPLVSRLFNVAERELYYQQYGAAEKHLLSALKDLKESVRGNILLARVYLAKGQFVKASAILSSLEKTFPGEGYVNLLRVELEMKRGRYKEGLHLLVGQSTDIVVDKQLLSKFFEADDIRGMVYLARLLWGDNQREKALDVYQKLLHPEVVDLLEKNFSSEKIDYYDLTRKESFWGSLIFMIRSKPEIVAELMAPDFLVTNIGTEAGRIVAGYFALYSWQKLIKSEYLARKAIYTRNYIYAEQSYRQLLGKEENTEGMIDLANIYNRFGQYRKEAQVYEELKNSGAASPELDYSMEKNSLHIRPQSMFDASYEERVGRNGHIDMVITSVGTSFWFTPELNKDLSLSYSNNQYDTKHSHESAGSNFLECLTTYEFGRDYAVVLGGGVNKINSSNDSTFLYSIELKGQLDQYVGAFLKGEKKLVFDTVEAVKDQIYMEEVSVGIDYATSLGVTFGGDFRHRNYNDGDSQNRFHGFSSYNYFGETFNLSLQYDYLYMRSEEDSVSSSPPFLEVGSTMVGEDCAYWSPITYSDHSMTLHFQHNFLGYQSGTKRGISYYSIDNRIGYENNEILTYRGDFNIFLEMSPHFLLKSSFTFSQSDVLEEKGVSLSLHYRW